jgi:hypothetical protein
MQWKWWHTVLLVAIGVAIDYFFPTLANMTLGKLTARKS